MTLAGGAMAIMNKACKTGEDEFEANHLSHVNARGRQKPCGPESRDEKYNGGILPQGAGHMRPDMRRVDNSHDRGDGRPHAEIEYRYDT